MNIHFSFFWILLWLFLWLFPCWPFLLWIYIYCCHRPEIYFQLRKGLTIQYTYVIIPAIRILYAILTLIVVTICGS